MNVYSLRIGDMRFVAISDNQSEAIRKLIIAVNLRRDKGYIPTYLGKAWFPGSCEPVLLRRDKGDPTTFWIKHPTRQIPSRFYVRIQPYRKSDAFIV